jgi:hypothetical protein
VAPEPAVVQDEAPLARADRAGTFELGPWVASRPVVIDADPVFAGATAAWHASDVLAIEVSGAWSPTWDLDPRPDVVELLRSSPPEPVRVTRLDAVGTTDLLLAPVFGALDGRRRAWTFDVSARLGGGAVATRDDVWALGKEDDPAALATASQVHPALSYGALLRVGPSGSAWALRAEARGLAYVEVLESTVLTMERPLLLSLGVTARVGGASAGGPAGADDAGQGPEPVGDR